MVSISAFRAAGHLASCGSLRGKRCIDGRVDRWAEEGLWGHQWEGSEGDAEEEGHSDEEIDYREVEDFDALEKG